MAAVAALGTGAGLSLGDPAHHRERRLHLNVNTRSLSKGGDTWQQPKPYHGPNHEKYPLTTTVRTPRTAFENDGEQFPPMTLRPLATSMSDSDDDNSDWSVIFSPFMTVIYITWATGLYVTYKVIYVTYKVILELVQDDEAALKKLESNIIARVEAAGNKIRKNYDGDVYYGQMESGQKHGHGTYTWASGNKYVGEWKNGKMDGNGTKTYPKKRRVTGSLKIITDSCSKYVGEWKNGNQDGNGTYTWFNGDKYVGEWVNDKQNGNGTFIWCDGKKYVGEWVNNKQEGNGTLTWTNGDKYVGEWKNGDRHGQGTHTKANGTIHHGKSSISGEWVQDDRQAETKTAAAPTEAVTMTQTQSDSSVILFGNSPVFDWMYTIQKEMDVYDFTGQSALPNLTSGGDIFVANLDEGENLNNLVDTFLAVWKRCGKMRESGQYVLDTKAVALVVTEGSALGTEWRNLASLADIDNDGEITFVEFVRAYSLMSLAYCEEKIFMDNP